MKIDENKVVIQTRAEGPKEPAKSLRKGEARFRFVISNTDEEAILESNQLEVNFLRALGKKKKFLLADSLDRWISS
jgi:hypothetical protein